MHRHRILTVALAALLTLSGAACTSADTKVAPAPEVPMGGHQSALGSIAPTRDQVGAVAFDWELAPVPDRAARTYQVTVSGAVAADELAADWDLERTEPGLYLSDRGGILDVDLTTGAFRLVIPEEAQYDTSDVLHDIADSLGLAIWAIRDVDATVTVADLSVDGTRIVGLDLTLDRTHSHWTVHGTLITITDSTEVSVADRATLAAELARTHPYGIPARDRVQDTTVDLGPFIEPGTDPDPDPGTDDGPALEPVELTYTAGTCDLTVRTCQDPWTIARAITGYEPVLVYGPATDRDGMWLVPAWSVDLDGQGVLPGEAIIAASIPTR